MVTTFLRCITLVFVLLTVACATGDEIPPLERRAQELNKAIMCPVCPGESIDQSQNALAVQMRAIVVEKLEQGWTEDQIKAFFVERYGPSVLMEPPRQGFSLAAWVIPPIVVLAAGLGLYIALRAMRRRASTQSQASAQVAQLSDEELAGYARRIEAALHSEISDSPRRTQRK
jgi:cytochrome c-type biogenesis protein CcmH